MLITMEKDIIWTFDVVSVERSGLHALLAGKVSNDEGDHLYSACEQAQTLLLTEGLTPRVWKSLSALRNTLLTVVETKLGTHSSAVLHTQGQRNRSRARRATGKLARDRMRGLRSRTDPA